MADHLSLGKMGEKLASRYLREMGFSILHQNWRTGHCEVDLIAVRNNVLHFIEVKTRRSTRFGYPEAGVTPRKLDALARAATEFQHQYPEWKMIQFDILSIMLQADGTEEFLLIEDIDL